MAQVKYKPRVKLIKKRHDAKKRQKDIADMLGVTIAYYSLIESGKRTPRYEHMVMIADYFKVKPDYFFYDNI